MKQEKIHILSLLAALVASVIFGMSFMFSKLALAVAQPSVLLAFRFTVAVAAMTLVIAVNALAGRLRGRKLFAFNLYHKPVGRLVLLGLVQPVAYFIFENYGILYTSSAVAGTIIAAVPVCCILMDVLVLHERVTVKQVLCALGAVGGVALISAGGAVMISALGLLFLLLTMLSDTVYYGVSHSAARQFTPFEMTYVMFVVGMAVFVPVALLQTGGPTSPLILHRGVGAGRRGAAERALLPVAGAGRGADPGLRVRSQRIRGKRIKKKRPAGCFFFVILNAA